MTYSKRALIKKKKRDDELALFYMTLLVISVYSGLLLYTLFKL